MAICKRRGPHRFRRPHDPRYPRRAVHPRRRDTALNRQGRSIVYHPNVAATTLAIEPPVVADPPPLALPRRRWLRWVALLISGLTLCAILYRVSALDLDHAFLAVPRTPLFWGVFAAAYVTPVLSEWMIFRRLWRIPLAGLIPLARKYVGNEILLGYIGEAYFYVWARERAAMTGAPFGAIKDVAILSAMAGNIVTLALMAMAYPLLPVLHPGASVQTLYLSLGVLVASSMAAFAFRRRLFSLGAPDLRFILGNQTARVLLVIGLAALMWHLALPQIALGWWLVLAALRQLLSRLPLMPNKDLAFAALTAVLIGDRSGIAAVLTVVATLMLVTHVVVGLVTLGIDFVRPEKGAAA